MAGRPTDGILYAIVASINDQQIAAEATRTKQSSIANNAKKVFNSLPKAKAEKRSYNYQDHCYNILYEANTIFMAVTNEDFSRVQCFTFLDECKKKWLQMGRNGPTFQPELKRLMDYFSDPANDKWKKLKANIEEVKEIMIDNIEKMVERGGRIDRVVEKTEQLSERAATFQTRSTKLARMMWWKNCKLTIIIVFILLVAVFVITVAACRKDGYGIVNFVKCKNLVDHHNPAPYCNTSVPHNNCTKDDHHDHESGGSTSGDDHGGDHHGGGDDGGGSGDDHKHPPSPPSPNHNDGTPAPHDSDKTPAPHDSEKTPVPWWIPTPKPGSSPKTKN